ncbi:MAG TPA: PAS domain S-box protein, partial [Prolixibacteraceae bacterium]|nr:PAS domain S-box protein [Prolixibacteraceae bacterium]
MTEHVKTNEELIQELVELQQKYDSLKALSFIDIADLRSKEKTMSLLIHAVMSISECVSITDMEDKIIFVNNAFLESYQYDENELLGNSITLVRSTKSPPELTDKILPETLQGGWKGEIFNKRKDGSEFPVYLSTSAIKDYHGEIIALVGISSDITERKRSELETQVIYEMTQSVAVTDDLGELLQFIHQSLKKVLYAENCFVAIHHQDTGLFSFPYFVDQFDPTPEPLAMGKSCTAFVFRTGKPLLMTPEVFERLAEQGEVEMVGSSSPSWIGVPLKTPLGTIGVLVLQHYGKEKIYTERDIHLLNSVGTHIAIAIERRQAEIELRENENLMQSVTNSAHDAILMMDAEG